MNKAFILAAAGVGAFLLYQKSASAAPRAGASRLSNSARPQTEMNQNPDLWARVGNTALAAWSAISQANGGAKVSTPDFGRSNPLDVRDALAWGYNDSGRSLPPVDQEVLDARDARILAVQRNQVLDARDAWALRGITPTDTAGVAAATNEAVSSGMEGFAYSDPFEWGA